MQTLVLAAQERHLLVARETLVIDLLLADPVALETVRNTFEVFVDR